MGMKGKGEEENVSLIVVNMRMVGCAGSLYQEGAAWLVAGDSQEGSADGGFPARSF
jgi:hypothetical protein